MIAALVAIMAYFFFSSFFGPGWGAVFAAAAFYFFPRGQR